MKKFISFKPDPLKPFNFKDTNKWRKEGNSYKLYNPDLDKDRQFLSVEFKKIGEGLDQQKRMYIAGIANANIIDRMDERLDPVGLDVVDYLKNKQLLAHHSYYHPIGQVEEIEVQDDGVKFKAWVGDPEKGPLTDMQKEIRTLIAQGILRAVSVGFIPHKIRPPAFNEQGALVEPCVIEEWELLELSVVAVPANQDSIFEMRGYASGSDGATLGKEQAKQIPLNETRAQSFESILDSLAEENLVVQSLVFDKDLFSEDEAKAWAEKHGFKADDVDDTDDTYRLRQEDPDSFDPDSFRTITLTEGVQAVVGKKKENEGGNPPAEENTNEGSQAIMEKAEEITTLLSSIKGALDKNTDMTEKVYQKVCDEKPSDDEGEGEDEGKGADEGDDALEKRMEKLEANQQRTAEMLEIIAGKLNKE